MSYDGRNRGDDSMNIGIVTTWFERGAAYVSKAYAETLRNKGNSVFIFARGGEKTGKGDPKWDTADVTWGKRYPSTKIDFKEFDRWIKNRRLNVIFFNEQQDWTIVADIKKKYPNLKLGSYVDYYTESTLDLYNIYDFVICNTMRHMEAMENHKQKFYLKWGTDVNVFLPKRQYKEGKMVFFHSVGMSHRKGTDVLLDAFIQGELYKKSKLIIHTQVPLETVSNYKKEDAERYGVEVIEKTISAPGLYFMGDVYVYPTRLDGLGLTIYEALASGLPVITSDFPPMNEVVDKEVGSLVKIHRLYSRKDGYYWPLCQCDRNDLIDKMKYYIDNQKSIPLLSKAARKKAVEQFDWNKNSEELDRIFHEANTYDLDIQAYRKIKNMQRIEQRTILEYFIRNNSYLFHAYSLYKKIKNLNTIRR